MTKDEIDAFAENAEALINSKPVGASRQWIYICEFVEFLYWKPMFEFGKDVIPRHEKVPEIEEVQAGIKAAFRLLADDAGYCRERYSTEWSDLKKKGYYYAYKLSLFSYYLRNQSFDTKDFRFCDEDFEELMLANIPQLFFYSLKPVDSIAIGFGALLPINFHRSPPLESQKRNVRRGENSILKTRVADFDEGENTFISNLPWGDFSRRLVCYLISQFNRSGCLKISLGKNKSQCLENLGYSTSGRYYSNLEDHVERLEKVEFCFHYDYSLNEEIDFIAKVFGWYPEEEMMLTPSPLVDANPRTKKINQDVYKKSRNLCWWKLFETIDDFPTVVISPQFAYQLHANPLLISFDTIKKLGKNVLHQDVYIFLAYILCRIPPGKIHRISWTALSKLFGVKDETAFKTRFIQALPIIQSEYSFNPSSVNYRQCKKNLVLKRSFPHVIKNSYSRHCPKFSIEVNSFSLR